MKRLASFLFLLAGAMFTAGGLVMLMGAGDDTTDQPFAPFPRGYQQITDCSSATSLTIPTNSQAALIQAEDQNIRLRDDPDGTAPTTSAGFQIMAGDALWYDGDLRKVQVIEETATAKVNILYYGY